MGRPPIGERAMTPAEKQRRYRERKFGNKSVVTKSTATLVREIKELARYERERDVWRQKLEAHAETVRQLKAGFERLEDELNRERALREAAEAKVANAASSDTCELQAELDGVRIELTEVTGRYQKAHAALVLHTEDIFTVAEYKKIVACLHPDRVMSEKEKQRYGEAFSIFSERFGDGKLLKKPPPPPPPRMPETFEEWMDARRRVVEQNRERGKRAAATRARKKPGRQLRDSR